MIRILFGSVLILSTVLLSTNETNAQLTSKRKPEQGTTLMSRLSKLKSSFFREDDAEVEETRENARYSREMNSQGSSSPQSPQRVARIPQPTAQPSRVQQGDFLPKGIFDRNADPGHRGEGAILGDEVFVTEPRRGSIATDATNPTVNAPTRRSPTTKRENELNDALSELLSSDLGGESATQVPDSKPSGSRSNTRQENSRPNAAAAESFEFDRAFTRRPMSLSDAKLGNTKPSEADEAVNDLRQKFEGLEAKPVDKQVLELPGPSFGMPLNAAPQRSSQPPKSNPQPQQHYSSAGSTGKSGGYLSTSKQPTILSRIEGPQRIMVGHEATYRVTLENDSPEAARSVLAEIQIPEWADVVDVISTIGTVEKSEENDSGLLRWKLQDLAAKSKQSLSIKLIPRSGKPLHLSVKWSQAPIASQAMVEVQEPKLEMKFGGPQEVGYNRPHRFDLVLHNPGTGPAENVSIRLVPPGGDDSEASTHQIGTIAAGESKKVELELTAREAGDLVMKAFASADGGLEAAAERSVHCRKAELEIDWRGPREKYAGTEAPYYFRLRNTGTAEAKDVQVRLTLPQDAKLVSASDGYEVDQATGSITWTVSSVSVGQEEFLQVLCKLDRPGTNRFDLIAESEGGVSSEAKEIETKVVAVADLKLSIADPKGPVPVGETAVYEIKIVNRGSTNAQNVGVVGLFSEGIDPTAVEGAQFSVRDGRVSIDPIGSLPAGQEVVLKIRAVASQAGTHIFRAEVSCQDLDIKLAAEETTKFYEDKFRWEDGETAYSSEADSGTLSR